MNGKQRVLVVDDESLNIDILAELLNDEYKIIVAKSGEQAISVANNDAPDLVLLDIMMPNMDGFEVCKRFKNSDSLKDVPILFISALNDSNNKINGFKVGAVDYITKPFQPDEVKARVRTHLQLYYLQKHLKDLVDNRTRQLVEAHEKLKDIHKIKNEFLHIINHQMRTPVNGILGVAEMIIDLCPETNQKKEMKDAFYHSRNRLLQMLDHTLMMCNLEENEVQQAESSSTIIINACKSLKLPLKTVEGKYKEINLRGSKEVFKNLLTELMAIAENIASNKIYAEVNINNNIDLELKIFLGNCLIPEQDLYSIFSESAAVHNASHIESLGLAPLVVNKIANILGWKVAINKNDNQEWSIVLTMPAVSKKEVQIVI